MAYILLTECQSSLTWHALEADVPAKCNAVQRCLAHASVGCILECVRYISTEKVGCYCIIVIKHISVL